MHFHNPFQSNAIGCQDSKDLPFAGHAHIPTDARPNTLAPPRFPSSVSDRAAGYQFPNTFSPYAGPTARLAEEQRHELPANFGRGPLANTLTLPILRPSEVVGSGISHIHTPMPSLPSSSGDGGLPGFQALDPQLQELASLPSASGAQKRAMPLSASCHTPSAEALHLLHSGSSVKAMNDEIISLRAQTKNQRCQIDRLVRTVKELEKKLMEVDTQGDVLIEHMDWAVTAIRKLVKRFDQLCIDASIGQQSEAQCLDKPLDTAAKNNHTIALQVSHSNQSRYSYAHQNDLAFQSCVCKVLHHCIRKFSAGGILLDPLHGGQFWTHDDVNDPNQRLINFLIECLDTHVCA